MLSSIDTYLHEQIEGTLGNLLSNRYIIGELLKEVQPNVRESFIKAYVYDEVTNPAPREIPILYTMPQDKQMLQGSIYIGLREGEETHPSIGNKESTYSSPSRGLIEEESTVQVDPSNGRMYLEVSKPIAEVESVEGIMFSKSDKVETIGNRLYFKYSPQLENTAPFTVWYEEESGNPARKGEFGLRSGFTTTEHYSILVLSTNMNTVRCLDLLMKAVLIYMRSTAQEHTNNLLQRVKFGQIEEINTGAGSDGSTPEILYGRETIVTYTTSYSMDVPIENMIKELQINNKLEY